MPETVWRGCGSWHELSQGLSCPSLPPAPGRQSCIAPCAGRLRSGEAERETARHPQGAVWILQVSAISLIEFLQYCLQDWFYTSFSPLVLLSCHQPPSLEPSQLCWNQLPIWNIPDSGHGCPFTWPRLGFWTRKHPFIRDASRSLKYVLPC